MEIAAHVLGARAGPNPRVASPPTRNPVRFRRHCPVMAGPVPAFVALCRHRWPGQARDDGQGGFIQGESGDGRYEPGMTERCFAAMTRASPLSRQASGMLFAPSRWRSLLPGTERQPSSRRNRPRPERRPENPPAASTWMSTRSSGDTRHWARCPISRRLRLG
jgi:hypothetical protein